MRIAMMSAWNEDSGVSVHAELIGREWLKMGHELKVFSFFTSDFHGTHIIRKDEHYVVRCFTTSTCKSPYLDPRPILESDFEIFIAQDLGMLPKDELAKIFHHIKRKASTVTIIHDSGPSGDPSFYQFDWDRIVCFDHRYREFLSRYHPEDRISIIPFPCHPLRRGDKSLARKKVGLPSNKKILMIFGQRLKEHLPLLPVISEVSSYLPILLLIVSQNDIEALNEVKGVEMEIRQESPSIDRLYDYLHASDVLLLHRKPCNGVVVSSTVYQCLGSGCPILALNSNFFETLGDVVVTYTSFDDFQVKLFDVLQRGETYQASQRAADEFLKQNSAEIIARTYLEHFQFLTREKRKAVSYMPVLHLGPWLEDMAQVGYQVVEAEEGKAEATMETPTSEAFHKEERPRNLFRR